MATFRFLTDKGKRSQNFNRAKWPIGNWPDRYMYLLFYTHDDITWHIFYFTYLIKMMTFLNFHQNFWSQSSFLSNKLEFNIQSNFRAGCGPDLLFWWFLPLWMEFLLCPEMKRVLLLQKFKKHHFCINL